MEKKKHHLNRIFFTVLSIWLTMVSQVRGEVVISEVAWMGDKQAAGREWIELYNNSTTAVVVDDWTLSDGKNLSIVLKGRINPKTYAVLERGDDSVTSIPALVVYSGALVNSGATLILKKSDGRIVDKVVGGKNWSNIGGDNKTKETAQRTLSNVWVTARPTPGLPAPATAGAVKPKFTTVKTNYAKTIKTKKNPAQPSGRGYSVKNVSSPTALKIKAPLKGYVNQTINFQAELAGKANYKKLLTYQWNFGNGEIAEGKKVTTSYNYPGVYIVVVRGESDRDKVSERHQIEILPIDIQLTVTANNQAAIKNVSPHEIDISGFKLQGQKSFIFPIDSFLLPNQTILFGKDKLGNFNSTQLKLFDFKGELKASMTPTSEISSVVNSRTEQKKVAVSISPKKISSTQTKSEIKSQIMTKQPVKSSLMSSRGVKKDNEPPKNKLVFIRPQKNSDTADFQVEAAVTNFGFVDNNTTTSVDNDIQDLLTANALSAVSQGTFFEDKKRFYKLVMVLIMGLVILFLYNFNLTSKQKQ